jgi:hypothetical protein
VISTHDLELVRLADENPAITNYHFREEIIGGRMVFDFRLRPGTISNYQCLEDHADGRIACGFLGESLISR